jgi:hypothetical protein
MHHRIEQKLTLVYAPLQNGDAECAIGVVCTVARALHKGAELPSQWWGASTQHVAWILNRLPTTGGGGSSVYELLWGQARFGSLESVPIELSTFKFVRILKAQSDVVVALEALINILEFKVSCHVQKARGSKSVLDMLSLICAAISYQAGLTGVRFL